VSDCKGGLVKCPSSVGTTPTPSLTTIMRYIPQSRYSFDEICKQCSDAINRKPDIIQKRTVCYDDILHFYRNEYGVLVAQ